MEMIAVKNKDTELLKKLKDLQIKENTLPYQSSIVHVKKALEIYPNDMYLLIDLSYLEYRMGHFDTAMDYVNQVEKINSHFGYMLCHKAWMLYDSGAPFQEAFNAWKEVIDVPVKLLTSEEYGMDMRWARSRQMDAYFYIADLLREKGDYAEAKKYVESYLKCRKNGVWSNFTKKYVESFFNDLTFYESHNLASYPRDSSPFRRAVNMMIDDKDKCDYLSLSVHAHEALTKFPDDVYFLTELSYAEFELGHVDEGMEFIRRAEKVNPYFGYMLYSKAMLLYDYGDSPKASLHAWNVFINTSCDVLTSSKYKFDMYWAHSRQQDAYFYSALCLRELGDWDEAEKYAKLHLEKRKRGLSSDFSKREVMCFLRELSFYDRNNLIYPKVDYGQTISDEAYDHFYEYIDKLDKHKDKTKIIRHFKRYLRQYPGSYFLWTSYSEYCYDYNMPKECLKAAEMANMICDTRDDMLVIFDYGSALYLNGKYKEAMHEFNYLLSKSLDYIAYNVHGEGMRYAKRLVRETNEMVESINKII